MNPEEMKKKHEQMLYPTVRVRTATAGGSGTVVYSGKNAAGEYETYVITNEHVVDSAIKVKETWNSRVGRMVKKDVRSTVQVELFRYNNMSRCIGSGLALEADVVAYDKEQDFALLKVREKEEAIDYVATMYPRDKLNDIHIFDPVYAVGAALGHAPLPTKGELVHMDDEIEDYKYWMSTACIIYGNSGGSVYRVNEKGDYEYVGIPSRLPISITGFSANPITHMGYFIPIDRIYKLLDEHDYQFVYDDSYTIEKCAENRDKKKKAERRRLERMEGGLVDEVEEEDAQTSSVKKWVEGR